MKVCSSDIFCILLFNFFYEGGNLDVSENLVLIALVFFYCDGEFWEDFGFIEIDMVKSVKIVEIV